MADQIPPSYQPQPRSGRVQKPAIKPVYSTSRSTFAHLKDHSSQTHRFAQPSKHNPVHGSNHGAHTHNDIDNDDDNEDEEDEDEHGAATSRPLLADNWLSAFQGRQVADGGSVGSSTAWRAVRTAKWQAQFAVSRGRYAGAGSTTSSASTPGASTTGATTTPGTAHTRIPGLEGVHWNVPPSGGLAPIAHPRRSGSGSGCSSSSGTTMVQCTVDQMFRRAGGGRVHKSGTGAGVGVGAGAGPLVKSTKGGKADSTDRTTAWAEKVDVSAVGIESGVLAGPSTSALTPTSTSKSTSTPATTTSPTTTPPQIFASVIVHINGSTHPAMSDYALKHVLVAHGATISISLARRDVTHVIVAPPSREASKVGPGPSLPPPHSSSPPSLSTHLSSSISSSSESVPTPCTTSGSTSSLTAASSSSTSAPTPASARYGRCGGGLAASKIQRELALRRAGTGGARSAGRIRFVTVEWVVASVRAGKRLPEREFAALKDVADRVGGVARWVRKG